MPKKAKAKVKVIPHAVIALDDWPDDRWEKFGCKHMKCYLKSAKKIRSWLAWKSTLCSDTSLRNGKGLKSRNRKRRPRKREGSLKNKLRQGERPSVRLNKLRHSLERSERFLTWNQS